MEKRTWPDGTEFDSERFDAAIAEVKAVREMDEENERQKQAKNFVVEGSELWRLQRGEKVAFLTKPNDMDMDAFMAEVNEMVVKANDYGWPHQITMAVINGWMILQAQRRE